MDPADLLRLVRDARRLLHEAGEGEPPVACPGCARPVPLEGDFCVGCGRRLRFPCPGCGARSRTDLAYCAACGAELSERVVGDAVEALAREAEAARRRREDDLLRRYATTRVLEEGRVRHLLGTRKDDGAREFVKVARSAAGRRLLQNELDALLAIGEHPGVIRLLEHRTQSTGPGPEDQELVAVFEHVESEALRFPLAIPVLLRLTSRVLEALEHVHARGIVHADLKPAHVLLRGGAPVLIDWNVSQPPGPSRFDAFTPMFAAPEQITGDRIDHRADLYAVGVILYLLFTHDRFPAVLEEASEPEPMLQVLQAKKAMNRAYLSESTIYTGKLKALQQQARPQEAGGGEGLEERRVLGAKFLFSSELSRTQDVNAEIRVTGDVLRIVQRATAVEPGDRFRDAAEMRAALDAVIGGLQS
ncbi:MAG: zinc ribbon domain-containing protein [Planctomycetota bacterium]